ncbi:MAG: hypothetical protein KJ822_11240 [Proteobacteria bacterium]|nr:hypothetical protein [Pseudomonadota bacterium]
MFSTSKLHKSLRICGSEISNNIGVDLFWGINLFPVSAGPDGEKNSGKSLGNASKLNIIHRSKIKAPRHFARGARQVKLRKEEKVVRGLFLLASVTIAKIEPI